MACPYCHSQNIYKLADFTKLGYSRYRCHNCSQRYNEGTGSPFNFLKYPTDIVLLILFHYARYKLSYEDVAEIFWLRGFKICAETIRQWMQRLGAIIGNLLRKKRYGKAGKRWHVDESYLQINSQWCYIYYAIDKAGHLVDVYLNSKRDKASAIKFFKSAIDIVVPVQITMDKNPAYPDAIKQALDDNIKHRPNKYLNNCLEQDHRSIKSHYYPMKGFKDFFCALILCTVFEEIRSFFKINTLFSDKLNCTNKRRLILSKFQKLQQLVVSA